MSEGQWRERLPEWAEACLRQNEADIAQLRTERDFNAASLRDANAELARLRAEVARLGEENVSLRADVARLERERDEAEAAYRAAKNGWGITSRRAEKAEARVAALEEAARAYRDLICTRTADGTAFYLAQQDLDALLAPAETKAVQEKVPTISCKPAEPCKTCGGRRVTSATYELDAKDCPDCRKEV